MYALLLSTRRNLIGLAHNYLAMQHLRSLPNQRLRSWTHMPRPPGLLKVCSPVSTTDQGQRLHCRVRGEHRGQAIFFPYDAHCRNAEGVAWPSARRYGRARSQADNVRAYGAASALRPERDRYAELSRQG